MRYLGIDYGERRVGVSYGDDIGVATPLPALTQEKEADRIAALIALAKERRVTDLVFGYPYNMNGTVGFKAREVDSFIEKVTALLALPIHRIDERLTSQEASKAFPKGRNDELRRSGKIDSVAATLILQDFLNQRIVLPEYDPFAEYDDGYEDDGEQD